MSLFQLCLTTIFVNILLSPQLLSAQSHKTVSVVLDSKWFDTPVYLEASEYLAEENPDFFWKYIDDFSNTYCQKFHSGSIKEQYDTIISILSTYLSPAKLSLIKFSLALRVYSPTIEAFHQIAYDQQLPEECETVIDVGGTFTCEIGQLDALLNSDTIKNPDVYKFDHQYLSSSVASDTIILYGDICAPSFREMYSGLKGKADLKTLNFILRHYVWKRAKRKVRLSGYGVELAVKSTEYKAQDDTKVKEDKSMEEEDVEKVEEAEGFVFSRLKELHPSKKDEIEELRNHILDSAKEIPTLKIWELQELSLQAAQRIVDSPVEEALRLMKDISQNFPVQAKSLIHVAVNPQLKKEVDKNQQLFMHHHNLGPTDAALFLNGMFFDMDATDIFTLLQFLKQETKVLEGLHRIGIPDDKILHLLKTDFAQDKQDYAVDIRDSAIQYINDLESDRPYRSWPSSVQDLLRPTYPGMLRSIKRNIYHLVIVADPSKRAIKDIYKLAESFYIHKAPVRIGFIFAVNPDPSVSGLDDAGIALLEAFNFIGQDKTPYDGLSFITDVYALVEKEDVPVKTVINQFKSKYPNEDLDIIFGLDSDYDTGRKLAWDFINRTGIGKPPQVLLNGVILKQMQLNADMFEEAIVSEIMKQTPFLQKSVYKGELTDSQTVLDFLMEQKNVMPRLNQQILSSESVYFDLTELKGDGHKKDLNQLPDDELLTSLLSNFKYLIKREEDVLRPLTLWIIGDLETEKARLLLSSALAHLKSSVKIRLGVIHNPTDVSSDSKWTITKLVQTSLNTLDRHFAKLFITKLIKEGNANQLISEEKTFLDFALSNMDTTAFSQALTEFDDYIVLLHSAVCARSFKLAPGQRAVVVNGRLIGPFSESEDFNEDDFHLLEKYSVTQFGDKLAEEMKSEDIDNASEMIMKATSVLLAQTQTKVRHELKFSTDKHSVVNIPAINVQQPAHEIVAIFDPVSKGAQKMTPLLMVLQKVINANIKVFLNCIDKHSSMPLKSFYRFVLEPELQFSPSGNLSVGPVAKFAGLPSSPLLTLAMATPENWLVEVVRSPYDLDNIHLEQVDNAVHADFELEHLLIEGHCFEQSTGNPPRGLQFTLGTNTTPVTFDTIVMANLGYFQLKANPGAWLLGLRQGRSSEIYDIVGHENTDSPSDSSDVVVIISSFKSHIIKVRVAKKPSKQYEELLYDESEEHNGIWNTITSMPIIGGIVDEWTTIYYELKSTFSGDKKESKEADDKINIFSLASGHLYERLLRIMMLSVLKHTKTPVKFWFLKNYLSPTFKDSLPYMAKNYGFEYELVQYKWPRWLNQQSEKQRVIWGYKILFLDVLFPLDVKKIIFVDADQIVRADMRELRDLDLGGAPYGYTPFCESRKDMDGYRFWKSGYWASHLAGRKYHISALYVVDLMKFRRIAAGDRLRGQYQGLSQDPNSLSNLDQDLPNNMIHQVNIKSLPQEWLWCETWCDDASKEYAKTIDLCNNPKTKEPKLVGALRLIPEWKDYDTELKKLFEEYDNLKKGQTIETVEKNTDQHIEL